MVFFRLFFRPVRWLWLACFGLACIAADAAVGDSAFFAWKRINGAYFWGVDLFDHRDGEITRETTSGFKIGLPLYFTNRLALDFGLGFEFWYPVREFQNQRRFIRFGPGIDRANLRYENEAGGWKYSITGGLFDFAADGDATVFGDYLLRYGAYPGMGVERPQNGWAPLGDTKVPLSGIDLGLSAPSGKFRQQLLGMVDSSASGKGSDFSLAYVLDYPAGGNVELGFGIEWLRFASTVPDETTPKNRDNAYVKTDTGYVVLLWDTTGTVAGDTGYYTRTATQIMIRAAFDLQGIFGLPSWGEKDWRVYTEAALLGVANQPVYYDERFRRFAFMAGVNLPSFGLLDRFVVEAEWHQRHYSFPDYIRFASFPPPVPGVPIKDPSERWKESVFISKTFFHWLSLQGIFIHYPVPILYGYSDTAESEVTYKVKTFLFDRFILRAQASF